MVDLFNLRLLLLQTTTTRSTVDPLAPLAWLCLCLCLCSCFCWKKGVKARRWLM